MRHNIAAIAGAVACVLAVATACTKVEVDTDPQPAAPYVPPKYSYRVDVDFAGDTALFSRNARFYFVTQQGADSVKVVDSRGDTLGGGTLNMDGLDSLHIRTTPTAAAFEGWLTLVMRDLPDPPATMQAEVTLARNDTVYFSDTFTLTTADISRTIRLSSNADVVGME